MPKELLIGSMALILEGHLSLSTSYQNQYESGIKKGDTKQIDTSEAAVVLRKIPNCSFIVYTSYPVIGESETPVIKETVIITKPSDKE
ncbi:MAG: Putative transcriptional regulator [Candidatus Midichloria mitochondrii]|nr:hypothetical protein [Candidatus Midichloria mitochondrii]MDJ1583854.1 hypothetical protein [Candidatus Midichloria mitochondrii]